MLANFELLIWDWNGTLLDDLALCVDLINGIRRDQGKDAIDHSEYRDTFSFPVNRYYFETGIARDQEHFVGLSKVFMAGYEERKLGCALQPHVQRVLQEHAGAAKRQAVLSAYPHDLLCQTLEHYRVSSYFEHLQGHQDIFAHSKVENGRSLMKDLAADPAKTVLIGDTVHDYEVATELGIDCVLLVHGHNSEGRLRKCAVPIVNCLSELI